MTLDYMAPRLCEWFFTSEIVGWACIVFCICFVLALFLEFVVHCKNHLND